MTEEQTKLFTNKIITVEQIAPEAFILAMPRLHDFVPGQVVGLTLDETDPPRLYSIASGAREDEMRILFNIIPQGSLTKKLSKLKKGDRIYVTEPFGSFYGKADPAFWIATGTGIAPYLSMYRSGLEKNKVLIHGSRSLDSFYFQKELKEKFGDHYIRCCTRESDRDVFKGRITEYLRQQRNLPTDYKYYLCGGSEMVVEVRDILVDKGIPFGNIVAEIYF